MLVCDHPLSFWYKRRLWQIISKYNENNHLELTFFPSLSFPKTPRIIKTVFSSLWCTVCFVRAWHEHNAKAAVSSSVTISKNISGYVVTPPAQCSSESATVNSPHSVYVIPVLVWIGHRNVSVYKYCACVVISYVTIKAGGACTSQHHINSTYYSTGCNPTPSPPYCQDEFAVLNIFAQEKLRPET